jgi:hypothetical protein
MYILRTFVGFSDTMLYIRFLFNEIHTLEKMVYIRLSSFTMCILCNLFSPKCTKSGFVWKCTSKKCNQWYGELILPLFVCCVPLMWVDMVTWKCIYSTCWIEIRRYRENRRSQLLNLHPHYLIISWNVTKVKNSGLHDKAEAALQNNPRSAAHPQARRHARRTRNRTSPAARDFRCRLSRAQAAALF